MQESEIAFTFFNFTLDAPPQEWHFNYCNAALPQLDRGSDYESERRGFESLTPHHLQSERPSNGAFFCLTICEC